MTEQPRPRQADRATSSDRAAQPGAERYRRYQAEIRSGNGARPLEFDELGFPLQQSPTGFLDRVARLSSLR